MQEYKPVTLRSVLIGCHWLGGYQEQVCRYTSESLPASNEIVAKINPKEDVSKQVLTSILKAISIDKP